MHDPIYIIGDIHGEHDRLMELMDKIFDHRRSKDIHDAHICFVGDYIDRGPDSKKVLYYVENLSKLLDVIALKGNHEDMMIKAFDSHHYQEMWLYNGGIQCLDSFGFKRGMSTRVPDIIGEEMFNWVESLPEYFVLNNVAVAHAGIDMRHLPVEAHTSKQLLWSRQLRMDAHDIYKYTVHGHTPMKGALVDEHVAYIDTGAVFGGKLTCLFIPDTENPNHQEMEIIDV